MEDRLQRRQPASGVPAGYTYRARNSEQVKSRIASAGGTLIDPYLRDDVKLFTPKVGVNIVRIIPPTWEGAEHYGFDLFLHYDVGADRGVYACIRHMRNEACPLCDERKRADDAKDKAYSDKLKPNKRVLVYIIDRNQEKEGPMVWSMPWTMDRDILSVSVDKRTQEVYSPDNPVEGFDVEFERKGTGLNTEYLGISLSRRSSPLGDPQWLEYAMKNNLPSVIQYYPTDRIEKIFRATGPKSTPPAEAAAAAERPAVSTARTEAPARQSVAAPAKDWDSIHRMSYDQMVALADAEGLKIDPKSAKDDADLADWICELLKIEKGAPPPPAAAAGGDTADRLARMRQETR